MEGSLDLYAQQLLAQNADDPLGNAIRRGERVICREVDLIGPKLCACRGVDQPRGHTQPLG